MPVPCFLLFCIPENPIQKNSSELDENLPSVAGEVPLICPLNPGRGASILPADNEDQERDNYVT